MASSPPSAISTKPKPRDRPVSRSETTWARVTVPKGSRQIGELVVDATAFDLPPLTGFENHGGITSLGPGSVPLGRVRAGSGNGTGGVEGAVTGHVIGTYLHGPALARNPALADLMLSWIVGSLGELDDAVVNRLRRERLRGFVG